MPEPVADTRPLPVVHHAGVDEHLLETGSLDAVALHAPDELNDLDPDCPFIETVLRPGGVLLLRCDVGDEDVTNQRVTSDYANGDQALLAYRMTLGDGPRRALAARARIRLARRRSAHAGPDCVRR